MIKKTPYKDSRTNKPTELDHDLLKRIRGGDDLTLGDIFDPLRQKRWTPRSFPPA